MTEIRNIKQLQCSTSLSAEQAFWSLNIVELVKSQFFRFAVIPAKAGIQ